MKCNFVKRIVAIILSLALLVSMNTVGLTQVAAETVNTSAVGGAGSAIAKVVSEKLMECGMKIVYKSINKLSESAGEEGKEIIDSMLSFLFLSSSEKNIAEIKELCNQILDELVQIEENLTDYTNQISGQIDNQNAAKAKDTYLAAWESDVTDVLDDYNLMVAFNDYLYYLVASTLYANGGLPENDEYVAIIEQNWKELTQEPITEETVNKAKEAMEKSFLMIIDASGDATKTYETSAVNNYFVEAINQLASNFVYDLTGENKASVTDTAATYAYFGLPYSHQQYEFTQNAAYRQVMMAVLLSMTYNEFLSVQGEYLQDKYADTNPEWYNEKNLKHTSKDNNIEISQSYSDLKVAYTEKLNFVGEQAVKLFDSDIEINATSYNGQMQNYTISFDEYMQAEDFEAVNLTINGFTESYNYHSQLDSNGLLPSNVEIDGGTDVTNKKYITSSTLRFNRVMSGSTDKQVYYILDPTQFSDSGAANIGLINHQIKRKAWSGIDGLYGDIYVASNDYLNLIKDMSDGANTYAAPNDLNAELTTLFDTPSFSAGYNHSPADYLAGYIPAKGSKDTYILSKSYKNDFSGSYGTQKFAKFDVGYITKPADNSHKLQTTQISLEDLDKNNHKYTLILANKSEDYLQNARIETRDVDNSVLDAKITYNNSQNSIGIGQSAKIKSGQDIAIKFKLKEGSHFVSLKCIRNNAQKTETILIDGMNELEYFSTDSDGYYTFDYNMPYSDVTFVLQTTTLEVDENGSFIIKTYDDLRQMSENINSGSSYYINGNYVVVNDINCYGEKWVPIGTGSIQFNGTLDGQGYTVSNLNVDSGLEDGGRYPLFAALGQDAVVKNLTVSSADVFPSENPMIGAGVIAKQNNGTIENCMVTDSNIQLGNWVYLGGIVGINNGKIDNCAIVNSNITRRWGASGTGTMGGIAERNNGTIENSYAYNCSYNNGTKDNGALIAFGNAPINSYYYTTVSVNKTYGTEKTADQFASGEVAYLLNKNVSDGTQAWHQNLDNGLTPDGYPVLANNDMNTVYKVDLEDRTYSNFKSGTIFDTDENGSFIIRTYADLCNMADMVNTNKSEYVRGSYILANDITCPANEEWTTPIGSKESPFTGTFYGQGHSISGLKYTGDPGLDRRVALFEYVEGATIKDVHLENIQFDVSNRSVAGLCSSAKDSAFINCSASGWIISSNTAQTAGLIAYIDLGTVEGCTNNVKITTTNDSNADVGGIIGYANEVTINKCMNRGNIITSASNVGGICGLIRYGSVNNCGNIGDIECSNQNANSAGVAVHYESQINNCYNVGNIDSVARHKSGVSQNTKSPFYYSKNTNCYYLEGTLADSGATSKTQREFSMGEVAYLLNKNVSDGTQAWYQNLDNGLLPNLYPQLTNNGKNTVYARENNKGYSNYKHSSNASVLERVNLRTYQRIIEDNGTFSKDSQIIFGFGLIDNESKTITVYSTTGAQRIGILMHQGENGSAGVMRLQGDYPKLKETSKQLLESGKEEPDIYTDGNGCIFVKIPKDGTEIPELTLSYTQKPTTDYEATLYTLKVVVVDTGMYRTVGATSTDVLDKTDPDYAVLHSDENGEKAPQTGDTSNIVLWSVLAALSLAALAVVLSFERKKKYKNNY